MGIKYLWHQELTVHQLLIKSRKLSHHQHNICGISSSLQWNLS